MAVLASYDACVTEALNHAAAAVDRVGRQLRRLIVLSGVLVDEYYQCTII